MSKRSLILAGLVFALAATSSATQPRYQVSDGRHDVLCGDVVSSRRAARDTTYVLGGPGRLDGKFQDASGNPDWQGWTHLDATYHGGRRWHVSTFQSPTGTPAIWCGQTTFHNGCDSGYGNDWREWLVFSHPAPNPGIDTLVRLQCLCRWDSEPGWDYFRVQQNRGGAWQTIFERDGVGTESVDQTISFSTSDYVGTQGNLIELRFEGYTDSAGSDEDCEYDSTGLAQVDDILVTIGAETYADDFDDGEIRYWTEVEPIGCGDFAQIWQGLQDIDPCATNLSPQVAFIDDGIVVPGTGGSHCISWCYGPGGYIVSPTGGLLGLPEEIDNLIVSPPLAWPSGRAGGILTFDVYRHEDLLSMTSPGVMYAWHVRSVNTGDLADLEQAPWRDRSFLYYGRGYRSEVQLVSDLLVPGCTYAQVGLRCVDTGREIWEYGVDGTPAPYFDNVAVGAFSILGPTVTAREIDLAQDSFPSRAVLDLVNLANNAVRFDMARNISPAAHLRNDPGDSVVIDVVPVRAGSVLDNRPRMVVKLKANPLFDAVRVLPPNFAQNGNIIDGWVYGDSTRTAIGTIVTNRFNFDLPDSNFFFPGDVIQYYFTASDRVNGEVGVTTLPDKLDGFGNTTAPMAYPNVFTVRALPSLQTSTGNQPRILFWNDAPDRGRDAPWLYALNGLGYNEHVDYDLYETNGASYGVGNGLGGRATPSTLAGYTQLLYTCGDLGYTTLGNNDFTRDPSNDIGVLTGWFNLGNKKAFMTGDDLVQSLTTSGPAGLAFMNTFLNVRHVSGNLLPLVANQTAPRVRRIEGNSVFSTPHEWVAFGGCPGINDFDAIEALGTTERLARFLDPSGTPDYTYAAATRYTSGGHDVILLPYDLSFIMSPPDYVPAWPGLAVRAEVLRDVLITFGSLPHGEPIAVPEARALVVSAGPNPFNPRCAIALDLPRAGAVSLRFYDIRGRLVRTLHDGALAAGRHELFWNGDDDAGRAVASGVYFYEVKAAGEKRIGKLALVR